MRRREFITVIGGTAAWPHILAAQGIDRSRRIGVLMDFAANDPQAQSNVEALKRRRRRHRPLQPDKSRSDEAT